MLKAAVIGASGYTGAELMRLLHGHPQIEVSIATANRYAGEKITSLYRSLGSAYHGRFERFDPEKVVKTCDIAFSCLPHGESHKIVPALVEAGITTVDLSADFRLSDPLLYSEWYGQDHLAPSLLQGTVYGLPEMNRDAIKGATLVANPGCFPTGALLGLLPAAAAGIIDGEVIIDSKTGISGAGRQPSAATHFPRIADGIEPYSVGGHRHLPEIMEQLSLLMGKDCPVCFTPHLVPMNRGILSTIYYRLRDGISGADAREIYEAAYLEERFVELLPAGEYPSTKAVQGSNHVHVGVEPVSGSRVVTVMTAIDNLVKGASGEAIQNMNLACGFPEDTGLGGLGLFP